MFSSRINGLVAFLMNTPKNSTLINNRVEICNREALELVGIMESDTEILDRLFSMFDKTGNDQINYKEFVGGLAPLCHGSVEDKLVCEYTTC